jgi:hypothetical protein
MHGWTIALALWGVIAPLIGILFGHYLTRSWQRDQWLLDNRKQGCRELLSVLSKTYLTLIKLSGEGVPQPPEIRSKITDISIESCAAIDASIFIAADLDREGIRDGVPAASVQKFTLRESAHL